MVAHPISPVSWQTFRQTFDQKLSEALTQDLTQLPLTKDTFLQEALGQIKPLSKQGKRLRPYIAFLAYEAAGGDTEHVPWDALVGVELVHLFALIHDDLIDHGKQRHGVETLHTFIGRRLQEHERNGVYANVAESEALLGGDLVYTWALKHLTHGISKSPRPTEANSVLFQLLEEVIVGQMLDVDLTSRSSEPYALIEQKMLLKTARYTFTRPMLLGAALAEEKNEPLQKFAQEFGDQLGLAFQLQDDWFDLIASEQRTGKTGYRDLEESQQTFFTCFVMKEGTLTQKERLARLLGYPLSKEQQEEAYALFTEVGAIKNGEHLIEKYFSDAERTLNQASFLPETSRQSFQSLLTFLKARSA